MRLKCSILSYGPGPSEAIIEIKTTEGRVEVVVDEGLVHDGGLAIRGILERRKDKSLIELPRETSTGRWRVWVDDSTLATG